MCIGDDGGCFAEADDGKGCRGLSTSSWDGQHVFLFVVSLYVLLCECNEYTYEWVYGLSACVCMYNIYRVYVCTLTCVVCVCVMLYEWTCTLTCMFDVCCDWHFRSAQRFNVTMKTGNCLMH